METYLTPEEVANNLRVSMRSVYKWLKSGQLESYRPFGRWLITPAHLDRFVKGGSLPAASVVTATTAPSTPAKSQSPMSNKKNNRR
jgi:excisionase family DNA binding protein